MVRFEILLPLYYHDGRQLEPEKFAATDDELVGVLVRDYLTLSASFEWFHLAACENRDGYPAFPPGKLRKETAATSITRTQYEKALDSAPNTAKNGVRAQYM